MISKVDSLIGVNGEEAVLIAPTVKDNGIVSQVS